MKYVETAATYRLKKIPQNKTLIPLTNSFSVEFIQKKNVLDIVASLKDEIITLFITCGWEQATLISSRHVRNDFMGD